MSTVKREYFLFYSIRGWSLFISIWGGEGGGHKIVPWSDGSHKIWLPLEGDHKIH